MGIQGLSKLLADIVPFAIKDNEMKNYFGEVKWRLNSHEIIFFLSLFRTKDCH